METTMGIYGHLYDEVDDVIAADLDEVMASASDMANVVRLRPVVGGE